MAKDKPTGACIICGKTKDKGQFYKNSNSSNSAIDYHPLCKPCIKNLVYNKANGNIDVNGVKEALKLMSLPFVESVYLSALKGDKETFGVYIKNLAINRTHQSYNKYKEVYDVTQNENTDVPIKPVAQNISENGVSESTIKMWGKGLSVEDYEFLDEIYGELIAIYDHKTPIQRMLYQDIANLRLEATKARKQGNMAVYEKLMNAQSKLMTDANIKPVQENASGDEGLSTWGEWIKKIEETEPIPEATKEFKDVDGIMSYVNRWFVRHFAKIFGLLNDNETIDDDIDNNLKEVSEGDSDG